MVSDSLYSSIQLMLESLNKSVTITDIAAFFGVIFGLSGLILGIMNYIRDQTNIAVTLNWDMKTVRIPNVNENKLWGLITVTNCGRRPVYINHVTLRLPKKNKKDYSHLILRNGMFGQKLAEADPPATFEIDPDFMEEYSKDWKKIRAEIILSTGKTKLSKRVKKKPSWAEE